jgi:hypothetical protein
MSPGLPNPPLPNRANRFQLSQIIQSVCSHCSKTIGYSPRPDILAIVERLHKCSTRLEPFGRQELKQ